MFTICGYIIIYTHLGGVKQSLSVYIGCETS